MRHWLYGQKFAPNFTRCNMIMSTRVNVLMFSVDCKAVKHSCNETSLYCSFVVVLLQLYCSCVDRFEKATACKFINPLDSKNNYSGTSNNAKLVHWPLMGGLLHLVQRRGAWAGCAPSNVTAHPSAASVPITVLLYDGPLLYSFNLGLKS